MINIIICGIRGSYWQQLENKQREWEKLQLIETPDKQTPPCCYTIQGPVGFIFNITLKFALLFIECFFLPLKKSKIYLFVFIIED